ncbi:MAG TPA: AI-2E family transporter [Gaiellaceae bacterium]|nr:AI-2E family transporter [Gaiellaceae bacterium]
MSDPPREPILLPGAERGDGVTSEGGERRADIRIPRSLVLAGAVSWRLLVVGAAIYATVTLLARLQVIIVPAAVAVLLACALWPGVRRLRARGVPPALAALTMLLSLLGAIAVVAVTIAPRAADEIGELDVNVSGGLEVVQSWLTDGPLYLSETRVDSFFGELESQVRSASGAIASGALGGAMLALEIVIGVGLAIVLLFFFLKDGDRMWYWLRAFLPQARQPRWHAIALDVRDVLAGFIRGTTIVALVDAVGIGLGLYLLDVPLVIPLAVLTFIGGYIPIVGATVAGFLAVMVGLVSNGFLTGLAVLAVVIAVQQLESNFLQPVVVGRHVQLHPAAVLLAVGAGAVLYGVAGALLAVPLTAALATVLGQVRAQPEVEVVLSTAPDEA